MSASQNSCPACNCSCWQELEEINLGSQHKLYTERDVRLCEAMTDVVRQHTPGYQMQRCDRCGLEYASPMVNPGSAWYGMAYGALSLYPSHRWEYDRVIELINCSRHIADFGCGSGNFLTACHHAGLPATGFDFSAEAISTCQHQGLQAEVLEEMASKQLPGSEEAPYSCITSFHVLEHLDNPVWFFKMAAASTSPAAQLLLSVPSDRRMTRVYGEKDFLDQPPHHLTRWTRTALEQIGTSTGWVLQDLEYEPFPLVWELWARAIRQPSYIQHLDSHTPRWQERLLRLAHYPITALQTFQAPHRLSGFSMLARYVKRNSLQVHSS
jgi:2-polyprenyl-3-methyl-5-hydroxy-6-metoxy-1,4-benzoquinol methylase